MANTYLELEKELCHRMMRYGLNPCGEIIGSNFLCNLVEVHLNKLDVTDIAELYYVFYTAGLEVSSLLHHKFDIEKFQYSRASDPIVGVSFTGLFDFFVNYFGVDWLKWWKEGRPANWYGDREDPVCLSEMFLSKEAIFLTIMREAAESGVKDYCKRNSLKIPNRCTTVQPAGTKSLLTGASPGWHPPKAQRFIRRITFRKDDPVAMACIDYGYSVVPSQSDKDEEGFLLNDPFDPRCTEWLVEIPVEVSWANLPGADDINPNEFSVKAQYDFYMQVQKYYTTHNTSATLEFREDEIDSLAELIYNSIQNDEGYISAALLARFDANETFPRLPFEPITKEVYNKMLGEVLKNRKSENFHELLLRYDIEVGQFEGPSGCDSDKCLLPEK
jgi:ribonucleotide reductase class II